MGRGVGSLTAVWGRDAELLVLSAAVSARGLAGGAPLVVAARPAQPALLQHAQLVALLALLALLRCYPGLLRLAA